MPDAPVTREAEVERATPDRDRPSRRDLVRRGLGVGATALAAAWTVPLLTAQDALAQADGDAAVVSAAITLEHTSMAAYDRLASRTQPAAIPAGVARRVGRQEAEHVRALSAALRRMGGTPPRRGDPELLASLGRIRSSREVARFALELETMAVAGYYEAVGKLNDAALLGTLASIMASDGQHLVLLRQGLGREPLPLAFETGQVT